MPLRPDVLAEISQHICGIRQDAGVVAGDSQRSPGEIDGFLTQKVDGLRISRISTT